MEEIRQIGTDFGWVANIIGIILGLITIASIVFGIYKTIKKLYQEYRRDYSSIFNYINESSNWTEEKLKQRKIAIIDDQPHNYPIQYLKDAGFNIKVYTSVSLANYDFIKEYDLIFLDITNVVREDLERGGFELIKRVKDRFPNVLTIGVSSKRFDPTLTEFFRLADVQSKTPISEKDCEELIIQTLESSFSPLTISKEIDSLISSTTISHSQHNNIIKQSIKLIENKIKNDEFCQKTSETAHLLDVHKLINMCEKLRGLL
ncbi:hypothetical protein ACWAU3_20315 [Shewanella sp. JL219SE-S6]|uniref:hypothetical protein n=1 Tax=Shewanella algae TaxID=38313 RepID=UPI001BF0C70F|nr:hypothetical protein [Shewanella algae]BCV51078.1 hypothetical protein TUM17382_37710 [Shewanella algae]